MLPFEPGNGTPFAVDDAGRTVSDANPTQRDTARLLDGPINLARRDALPSMDVRVVLLDTKVDTRPSVDSPRFDTRLDTGSVIPPPPPPLPPRIPLVPPPDPPIVIDGGPDAGLVLSPNACPSGANLTLCDRQGLTCLIYTNDTVIGGCVCLALGRTSRWFCLQ